jgi:general secretion pathway protein G
MRKRMIKDDMSALERGFTLVELLIVVVILGILAGVVVFAVGNFTTNAQTNACQTERRTLETGIEAYRARYNAIPTESGTNNSLVDPPGSDPAIIKAASTNFNIDAAGNLTLQAGGVCP